MRSPIIWFGGKGNMVKKLLQHVPPHDIYVEVFGGGATLLFAKEPAKVEVYNDLDSALVNFFRILRDPRKFKKFYRKVVLTPYSREEQQYCAQTWKEQEDEIEQAYRWYVAVRMSFSGNTNGWSFSVTKSHRGMSGSVSKWLSTVDSLPQVAERMKRVQVEHKDFRFILKTYDTPQTFFYLDPPYISETRRSSKYYQHEMTLDDHKELVNLLLSIKGKAMLSGYKHDIYNPLEEAGWKRIDYHTSCHAVGRTRYTKILGSGSATQKQPRIESIWLAPQNFTEESTNA